MGLKSVTTDRVDEIRQSIGTILKELLTNGSDEMENYFVHNTNDVVDELYGIMNGIYKLVYEVQQQGDFGKLSYVRVFPRRVAILENSYSFIIRVYDEKGYQNPVEVSDEWTPTFLNKLFENQLIQVEKRVNDQIFQLTTRERQLVKLMYADAFTFLVMMFLTILRTAFVYVENISNIKCEERITLTYGNYLEQGLVVEVFDKPGGELR